MTTTITQSDIALLAAHVGTRQDGRPVTYADALESMEAENARLRQALAASAHDHATALAMRRRMHEWGLRWR